MADRNGSQLRHEPSYHTGLAFTSPPMQSTYSYTPPHAPTSSDSYHSSPSASNSANATLSLPPIRAIERQAPSPSQAQIVAQQHLHSSLPPPIPSMSAYYNAAQTMAPSSHYHMSTSSPLNLASRFPLPMQSPDQRLMSGGRHKKEIKRRTKTGCLTCRKRRIKCDETHPTCRNCQKSKRDCLGYDPIFKQQPQPAQIQPAPGLIDPHGHTQSSAPAVGAAYASIPPGYPTIATPDYSHGIGSHNSLHHPGQRSQPFDFGGPLESALSAPDAALAGGLRPDIKPTLALDTSVTGISLYPMSFPTHPRKVSGIAPPSAPERHTDLTEHEMEDVRKVYVNDYAPGLDDLLETSWYSSSSFDVLVKEKSTLLAFAHLIDQFRTVRSDNFDGNRRLQALEADLVWQLLRLCNSSSALPRSDTEQHPLDPSVDEAKRRLQVLEAMLTWHFVDINPIPRMDYADQVSESKQWEIQFWSLLGTFVSTRENDSSTSAKEIETVFALLRQLLVLKENRDVLYSIAIARHLGGISPGFPDAIQGLVTGSPEDPTTKLVVAKRFLEEESLGKGTNQVIQRISGMAARSWVV